MGHFGLPALSVMLYDPAAGQSTFIAFDSSLQVAQQVAVPSWNHHWQILIGAFLDRSSCQSAYHCASIDDVLILNRQSGHIQQYSFTFGNQYKDFDNRLQAFLSEGVVITARLQTVDTSSFNWQVSLDASITTSTWSSRHDEHCLQLAGELGCLHHHRRTVLMVRVDGRV